MNRKKSRILWPGMLAVAFALVFGIGFSACDTGSGGGGGGGGDPVLTGSVSAGSGETPQVGIATFADTSGLNGQGVYTYQWQRGDTVDGEFTDIDGETMSYYIPLIGDLGKYIRVVVGLAGYSGTQTSVAVGPVLRAGVSNLTRTLGNGQVTLDWYDPTDNDLDHIEITWTDGSDKSETVNPDVEEKTIESLTSGATYTFTVTTVYTENIKGAEARVTVTIPLTSVAAVATYLSGASGGNTAANPVPLPVILTLSSDWTNLLGAINTADKYVDLDLSLCTSDAEFDPAYANDGESKVVSLILPDDATSIKAGSSEWSVTFTDFTALTSVSGQNIETVGEHAFSYRQKLTTVSFPEATEIGGFTFKGCIQLSSAYFPKVTEIGLSAFSDCRKLSSVRVDATEIIGDYAFSGCGELSSVDLSKATDIGDYAFYYCTGLNSVDLRAATAIGSEAFSSTGDTALTVTLGDTVPELWNKMFANVSSAKTVTVRVPNKPAWSSQIGTFSGSDKTVKWGNGFRGAGWYEGAFFYEGASYINSNISLTVTNQ